MDLGSYQAVFSITKLEFTAHGAPSLVGLPTFGGGGLSLWVMAWRRGEGVGVIDPYWGWDGGRGDSN